MLNRLIKSKYIKLAICLSIVICLFVTWSVPASAVWNATSKNRFGAWLGSALLALNITMQSTVAPIEQMYEYIADPVIGNIPYEYAFNTDWEDDIMDRSIIKIAPDVVTIDGQKYTDVWLSHDAAEKFRTNAFDFKTGYSLASNTNGTFASGEGILTAQNGEQTLIYNVNNQLISTGVKVPANVGTYYKLPLYYGYVFGESSSISQLRFSTNGQTSTTSQLKRTGNQNFPLTVFAQKNNTNDLTYKIVDKNGTSTSTTLGGYTTTYVSDSFDFDYVTGVIPAEEVLPSDHGMNIRIPSDTPGLQLFIENNIDFTYDNGKTIDFNLDPDIQAEIDDLIDIIAPILVDLDFGDVTFTTMPDTPTPQPVLPDTVFPDTQVDDALQPIINTINNNTQNIIESIPAPSEISNPIIQEIQNTGDEIIENIPKIDEICNNIDAAPINDLDLGTSRLPTFLLPYITDLRGALGIWHYVTEWVGAINSTFSFILGVLAGTSIMTPIYASIAGYMCIRAYRRMCS